MNNINRVRIAKNYVLMNSIIKTALKTLVFLSAFKASTYS